MLLTGESGESHLCENKQWEEGKVMSLRMIHEIFDSLPECEEWNAHLLKFKHSKNKERHIIAEKLSLNH